VKKMTHISEIQSGDILHLNHYPDNKKCVYSGDIVVVDIKDVAYGYKITFNYINESAILEKIFSKDMIFMKELV